MPQLKRPALVALVVTVAASFTALWLWAATDDWRWGLISYAASLAGGFVSLLLLIAEPVLGAPDGKAGGAAPRDWRSIDQPK